MILKIHSYLKQKPTHYVIIISLVVVFLIISGCSNIDTKHYKSYTDSFYGFGFFYPKDWRLVKFTAYNTISGVELNPVQGGKDACLIWVYNDDIPSLDLSVKPEFISRQGEIGHIKRGYNEKYQYTYDYQFENGFGVEVNYNNNYYKKEIDILLKSLEFPKPIVINPGRIKNHVYINDYLKMRLKIPDNWRGVGRQEYKKVITSVSHSKKSGFDEKNGMFLFCFEGVNATVNSLVMKTSNTPSFTNCRDFLKAGLASLKQKRYFFTFNADLDDGFNQELIGGRIFETITVHGRLSSKSPEIKEKIYCTSIRGYYLLLVASSETDLGLNNAQKEVISALKFNVIKPWLFDPNENLREKQLQKIIDQQIEDIKKIGK